MTLAFFVSDLHGNTQRYSRLLDAILKHKPAAVFLGGDILPSAFPGTGTADAAFDDFVSDFLLPNLDGLRAELGNDYPEVYVILGNDDPRVTERSVLDAAAAGLWTYMHGRRAEYGRWTIYGYSYVPPTPFLLKDWERYDVSRYVDPGSVSPEEGARSVGVNESERKFATIADDLDKLAGEDDMELAVFLFHAPPYGTALDRAGLDGMQVEGIPLDVHVGSIAIRRFIEGRQPLVTLHGHVHESAGLTGRWIQQLGRTFMLSAAHQGPELALVRFDLEDPGSAERELL